mgnify:CR=1 FL=1
MNLFIELRKHGKLAAKRNPMYEKNKFGKFWMYFMAVFWAGYLGILRNEVLRCLSTTGNRSIPCPEQRAHIYPLPGFPDAFSISENACPRGKALSAVTGKTQPSYRLPADTFRIERLQPDMAVLLRSVRHHQHHQILRHNGCTDL